MSAKWTYFHPHTFKSETADRCIDRP